MPDFLHPFINNWFARECEIDSVETPMRSMTAAKSAAYRSVVKYGKPYRVAHAWRTWYGVGIEADQFMVVPPPNVDPAGLQILKGSSQPNQLQSTSWEMCGNGSEIMWVTRDGHSMVVSYRRHEERDIAEEIGKVECEMVTNRESITFHLMW